jgi:hypothetical protein
MQRLLTAAVALAALGVALTPHAWGQSSAGGGGGGGSGGTVSVSNFPATQPVSGTVAATQSGAWSTGLTGSLPAFAATPTFNVGTIAGIATDASVQQVKTALGSPLQAGGAVSISNLPASQAVTNGGTFSVQNTAATPAGANVIGRVGIDQTTPGTTNAVAMQGLYASPLPTLTAGSSAQPVLDPNGRLDMTMRQTLATPGNNPGVGNSVQGLPNAIGFPLAPSTNAGNGIVPVAPTASAFTYKAAAGNLFGFSFTQGTTAGFFAILNLAAAPSSGAAISPLECIPVAASAYVARRQDIPDRYSTGITIVSTSSCSTYTPVTPVLMTGVVQ